MSVISRISLIVTFFLTLLGLNTGMIAFLERLLGSYLPTRIRIYHFMLITAVSLCMQYVIEDNIS